MKRIREYLDNCFGEYVMNEELKNLKEEVLANATDHYADLLSQGESEEAAEETVLLSLGDIGALLRQIGAERRSAGQEEAFDPFDPDRIRAFTDTVNSLFSNLFRRSGENGTLSEVYAEIDELQVHGSSMEIHTSASEDELLHVNVRGNLDQIVMEAENGVLVIRELSSGISLQNGIDLVLEIPERVKKAEFRLVSGDVEMESPVMETMRIQTASGDLSIRRGSVEDLAVKTASGDIRLRLKKLNRFYGELASGDVDVKCTHAGQFLCTCQSGDIEAEIEQEFESVWFRTVSGDVSLKLKNPPAVHTELQTVSGSVNCRLPSHTDGSEINISTVTGDIRIRD